MSEYVEEYHSHRMQLMTSKLLLNNATFSLYNTHNVTLCSRWEISSYMSYSTDNEMYGCTITAMQYIKRWMHSFAYLKILAGLHWRAPETKTLLLKDILGDLGDALESQFCLGIWHIHMHLNCHIKTSLSYTHFIHKKIP